MSAPMIVVPDGPGGSGGKGGAIGWPLVLLLSASLLVGFSSGRWLFPLAAWIGPALIIRFYRDHRVGRAFFLVFGSLVLAFAVAFGTIWAHWGAPEVVMFAIGYGFLWTLPYLADRLLSPRLGGFLGTLAYPLAATTLEFVNVHINPVGAWGATGFTQYGFLVFMQLASVTGMIGMTFLMGWFASMANWTWESRKDIAGIRRGLIVFAVVFVSVMVFGFLRLSLTPTSETNETVRVAGLTAESAMALVDRVADEWETETARNQVESFRTAYFEETVREAEAGARVIVWPEVAGIGASSQDSALITRAMEVAREQGIYLTVPLGSLPSDPAQPFENRVLVIDPTGTIVIDHVKYGGAALEPGRLVGEGELQAAKTPFGVLSAVICYDMDFPAVVRQSGKNNTGLMLVPSADWFSIDPVHSQMAVFRAIENGMSLVRQVDQGLSIAVDQHGRTLAQSDYFGTTDRTLVAQVPTQHVETIYTTFGHWFEWVCLIGFLAVISLALVSRYASGSSSSREGGSETSP